MTLTERILSKWRIEDLSPPAGANLTGATCMALSPTKHGDLGPLNKMLVGRAVYIIRDAKKPSNPVSLIFSNRFTVNQDGCNIAESSRRWAHELDYREVVTPFKWGDRRYRNTRKDAEFAIHTIIDIMREKDKKEGSLLIVADSIHMPRVLATFRKITPKNITLYWESVDLSEMYGPNFFVQSRFSHQTKFLLYELLAMLVFKLRRWA